MTSSTDYKKHWERVYINKDTSKVSWYQSKPQLSLDLIEEYATSKSDSIIDVGAGDSTLPDNLLEQGFNNISVLDISSKAIAVSQHRLSTKEYRINWIIENVLDLDTTQRFNLWHDRAVFHFLTLEEDKLRYKEKLKSYLTKHGTAIIGSFSRNDGPKKCSGLNVSRYDKESLSKVFYPEFKVIEDLEVIHQTPSGAKQNFYWAILKKLPFLIY